MVKRIVCIVMDMQNLDTIYVLVGVYWSGLQRGRCISR